MELFIVGCVAIVGLFGVGLLLSTVCMGSKTFLSLQVLMGSLRYGKETNDKIDILLGKVEAELYYVQRTEHTLRFYPKEKYDSFEDAIQWRNEPEVEIWTSNKFYSYGNIHRINGREGKYDLRNKRPSIKNIKQIYQLELSDGKGKQPKKTKDSKTEEVILG